MAECVGREEQAALAHRGSGQAARLRALGLCHGCSFSACAHLPAHHPHCGQKDALGPRRGHLGTQETSTPEYHQHFWGDRTLGGTPHPPYPPCKALSSPSIWNHHGRQGGVPRVRGTYNAPFP